MPSPTRAADARSRLRKLALRLGIIAGGIVAGFAALVAVEVLLRWTGIGASLPRVDPLAGFSKAVPFFDRVSRDDGTPIYAVAERRSGPRGETAEPQRSFLAKKPPGTFRIFAIGGSSTAGVPYGSGYAFPMWLAKRLAAELPDVPLEVVNAALPGWATPRELRVVKQIAGYSPDLLIVYTGHNEFAENRYYARVVDMDPRLFRLWELIGSTRLYRLASRAFAAFEPAGKRPATHDRGTEGGEMFAVAPEGATKSDYPDARERAFHDALYRRDLEEMVRTMQEAGARVVLVTLSQNFADWAPGASDHREGIASDELARFDAAAAEGDRLAAGGDCASALEAYGRARAIDDRYAELVFRIAQCERRLGRLDEAALDYRRASDLDRVPHGAPRSFNDSVREVAKASGALLVDADAVLAQASTGGLVGDDLFVDFVHPNLRAQELIAGAVADALRDAGIPRPAAQWRSGQWKDPDVEDLHAADPTLRLQEHLTRASICFVARRACAQTEIDAVLALDPANASALWLRGELEPGTPPR